MLCIWAVYYYLTGPNDNPPIPERNFDILFIKVRGLSSEGDGTKETLLGTPMFLRYCGFEINKRHRRAPLEFEDRTSGTIKGPGPEPGGVQPAG